jgi:hypothetical protein
VHEVHAAPAPVAPAASAVAAPVMAASAVAGRPARLRVAAPEAVDSYPERPRLTLDPAARS